MARRGNPEKIYHAQRAGMFTRLVSGARLDKDVAEDWIARWEREAKDIGWPRTSSRFWDEGWDWIERERSADKS